MNRRKIAVLLVIGMLAIAGCGHAHTWAEATCATPKTCSECGATEGEVLEHTWVEATCAAPKTCSGCGTTEGETLEHAWVEATYTTPKTCSECGETEGTCKQVCVEEKYTRWSNEDEENATTISREYEYECDAKGNITKKTIKGTPSCVEYEYDEKNNLIKEIVSDGMNRVITYEYDENGNLIKEINDNIDFSSSYEITYEYDESGKKVAGHSEGFDIFYEYDTDGNMVKSTEKYANDSELICEYEYDAEGTLLKTTKTDNAMISIGMVWTTIIEYVYAPLN